MNFEERRGSRSFEELRAALNSLERLSRASRSVEEEPRKDQRRGGPLYAPWDSVASESRPAVPPRTALEVFVHELHCIQAAVAVVADDVMVCFVAVPSSWRYFVRRRTPDGLGSRRFLRASNTLKNFKRKASSFGQPRSICEQLGAASGSFRTAWNGFAQLRAATSNHEALCRALKTDENLQMISNKARHFQTISTNFGQIIPAPNIFTSSNSFEQPRGALKSFRRLRTTSNVLEAFRRASKSFEEPRPASGSFEGARCMLQGCKPILALL